MLWFFKTTFYFYLGLFVLLLVGCASIEETSTISVSPLSLTIGINKTQQFYAVAYNLSGSVVPKSFTWSVEGGIGTIDAQGVFYSSSIIGSGHVVATVDNVSGKSSVNVTDKGQVQGMIINSQGEKLYNVFAFISQIPTLSATTDKNGAYKIENIPYGTYEVVTRENLLYLSSFASVFVFTGEVSTVNFVLENRLAIENESFSSNPVSVSGNIHNNGTTEAQGVSILYSFYDETGSLVSSASQSLGNIPADTSVAFYLFPSPLLEEYSSVQKIVSATSY